MVAQFPEHSEFQADPKWPQDLAALFDEAARAYAARAFTASAMASRKILMACACENGDDDGKRFVEYVDYLTNHVLTFPKARSSIDAIRGIGNDANHKIEFVSQPDAKRALSIVSYMLNTIYALPSA